MAWARDNNTTSEVTAWAQSLTFSFTVNSGSNRLLVVSPGIWDSGDTITAVTYNGVSLTKAIDSNDVDPQTWKSSIWYLVAPPVGTANVVLTFGGGDTWALAVVVGATVFTGIDQTTPVRASTASVLTDGGTTQNPYVNVVNCQADDLVYGVCLRNGADLTPADTSDWVEYNDTDNEIGSGTYTNGTVGTVQLNWTSGAAEPWACVGVAFIPASIGLVTRRTLLGVGV